MNRIFQLIGATSAAALLSSMALAQTADTVSEAGVDEKRVEETVYVTATKRAVSLDRSAGSIAAVTAADLEDRAISTTDEIFATIPNVIFDNVTLSGPAVNIRGVANENNGVGFEPAVPVYVDEIFQPRPVSFVSLLSDVERVEVLRGPQGTLFGKNTIGGLVNIVTNKPTDEFEAAADISVGSLDLFQARGMVNIPISEGKAALRITGATKEIDGWLENRELGAPALYGQEYSGARAQLLFTPNHSFNLLVSADASSLDGTGDQHTDIDGDPFDRVTSVGSAGAFSREDVGISSRLEVDFGSHSFVSLSAFRETESEAIFDQDFSAAPGVLTSFPEDLEIFTQEFRVVSDYSGPFNFIAGAFYLDQSNTNAIAASFGSDTAPANAVVDTIIDTESYALFLSGDFDISEKWTVSAGGRYTDESKSYDIAATLGAPLPSGSVSGSGSVDDDAWSGDITLSYDLNESLFLYGKYARGFKAGGFDNVSAFQSGAITAVATAGLIPFVPSEFEFAAETVDNYEAGFKYVAPSGNYRIYGSAFVMNYQDKQEQVTRLADLGGTIVPIATTTNAAEVDISGIELETWFTPAVWWDIQASLGWIDSEYGSFVDPFGGTDLTGNELPRTPDLTGSFASTFSFDGPYSTDGMFRAEAVYRAENFLSDQNDNFAVQDAHTVINLRAGLDAPDNGFGVYIFGKNITDETVFLAANTGLNGGVPIAPDTWGIELRFRR
ncbi:MAG: TonB-dependent receptor [Henriciella sp.]